MNGKNYLGGLKYCTRLNYSNGYDLEELRARLNIDKKQFKKAIKELDDDVDVTQTYKGKVNYSVLPYILQAEALRYKVKY